MAYCTKCGTNVDDEVKFCTACGQPMSASADEQPKPQPEPQFQPEPPPPPPQPPPQPQPVYTAPVQTPQPVYTPTPSYSINTVPPQGSPYAVMGTGAFFGYMLLFMIPIIGWIACIIFAFVPGNRNRRNFARAMLIFVIIGIVLAVALYFLFSWVLGVISDYISEITYGIFEGFSGLTDLFDVFSSLDDINIPDIDIPAMP